MPTAVSWLFTGARLGLHLCVAVEDKIKPSSILVEPNKALLCAHILPPSAAEAAKGNVFKNKPLSSGQLVHKQESRHPLLAKIHFTFCSVGSVGPGSAQYKDLTKENTFSFSSSKTASNKESTYTKAVGIESNTSSWYYDHVLFKSTCSQRLSN